MGKAQKKSFLAQIWRGAGKTVVLGGALLAGGMITLAIGTFTTNFPTEKVAGDKLSVGTWNDLMHTVNVVASHFNDTDGKITADEPVADNEVATKAYVDAASSAGGSGVSMMSAESGSTMNHVNAAKYCWDLSASSEVAMDGDTTTTYDDWHLPSVEEAVVFEGTITDTSVIWTSSVRSGSDIYWIKFSLSDGLRSILNPGGDQSVRCVR